MEKNNKPNDPADQTLRPALGLLILCQALDELALAAESVLRATGLTREFLETPGALIRREQEVAFIEQVLATNPRPDLAYRVGLRYHYGAFGVWGLAVTSSENLLQAFAVAHEFIELTHSFSGLKLQLDGEIATVAVHADYPVGAVRNFVIERDLVITLMIASEAAGRRLRLVDLELSLPQPAHAAELERMAGVAIRWGAPATLAHIHRDELLQPLPQANPITWSACVRQCRELIASQHGERPFAMRLQQLIAESHFAGIKAVSARLGMSERSLRRRLGSQGLSFRQLQETLRRELAEQCLADPALSLEAIAERLGYSETANFCHAFRRWTGCSPGLYRRDLLARDAAE